LKSAISVSELPMVTMLCVTGPVREGFTTRLRVERAGRSGCVRSSSCSTAISRVLLLLATSSISAAMSIVPARPARPAMTAGFW
jgi:hypothetical protein